MMVNGETFFFGGGGGMGEEGWSLPVLILAF